MFRFTRRFMALVKEFIWPTPADLPHFVLRGSRGQQFFVHQTQRYQETLASDARAFKKKRRRNGRRHKLWLIYIIDAPIFADWCRDNNFWMPKNCLGICKSAKADIEDAISAVRQVQRRAHDIIILRAYPLLDPHVPIEIKEPLVLSLEALPLAIEPKNPERVGGKERKCTSLRINGTEIVKQC
ncbi:hypothetical protein T439DRAFT_56911 [Meredithblackwellia eburnea MCA 4105]